jgi:hypothetical protein
MRINGSVYSHPIPGASIIQEYANVVRPNFSHGPWNLNPPDAGYAKIGAAVFAFDKSPLSPSLCRCRQIPDPGRRAG